MDYALYCLSQILVALQASANLTRQIWIKSDTSQFNFLKLEFLELLSPNFSALFLSRNWSSVGGFDLQLDPYLIFPLTQIWPRYKPLKKKNYHYFTYTLDIWFCRFLGDSISKCKAPAQHSLWSSSFAIGYWRQAWRNASLAAEAYGCIKQSCEKQMKTMQTSEWGTDVRIDRVIWLIGIGAE